MVSVAYWTIWVVGSNPTVFLDNFFSFKLKRLAHFRLEVSSKCDLKAENSSTLCKGQTRSWKRCYNHEQKNEIPIAANFVLWFFFRHIFFKCGDLFCPSIVGDVRCILNLKSDCRSFYFFRHFSLMTV